MNHIERLTRERNETREVLDRTIEALTDLICYVESSKFAWPDHDYIHVRTDLLPKLLDVRRTARV